MPNYAAIAAPLHRASQKGERFRWTVQCEEPFASIKRKLTNAPILAFPQRQGLRGSVISGSGWERARYSLCGTTRKELLALVWGAEHFETYLYSRRFLARTDHSALQWLQNFKNPRGEVAHWLERLSDFDFEVEHRSEQSHGNADGLSRLTWESINSAEQDEDAMLINSINIEPLSREV